MMTIWIHELPDWPQLIWDDAALSTPLAQIRYRQGRLLGRMSTLGFDLKQEANLSTLTNDLVKSFAIEGEILDREEVRSSIARQLGLDVGGVIPSSRDVDGVAAMMLDATQRYRDPLTADRLLGWHGALFPTGRSGLRRITVGAWRPESVGAMQVVSGAMGREQVHFEAPAADRIEREMAQFLRWFEADQGIDPVLKAGLAHLWFITIHPFEDGNGRIARAITDLALARADASPDRFYSMSTQIEAERRVYYQQLERQQRHTLDVTGWLEWFLGCLGRAIDRAEQTLTVVLYKARVWDRVHQGGPVNDRQQRVLNRMLGEFQGYLSTSKYAKLAKCSTDSALRDIRELVDRGILVRNPGGGRSTNYRLVTIETLENRGGTP